MKFDIKKLHKALEGTHITKEKHPTENLYIYGVL